MWRVKRMAQMIDLRNKVEQNNEYDYDLDLNWKDDVEEASMNDYLKGYQEEPYAFKQWASKHKKDVTAASEVYPMHFYPEFLADYILTKWNGVDGSLQDFYEGFTLRYNNNLKRAVAEQLKKLGYTVYPVLTDDRAFYAKRLHAIMRVAHKAPTALKLNIARRLFSSEALSLCLGEVDDIQEMMHGKMSKDRIASLLDYYKQLFPEDYAIVLTTDMIKDTVDESFYEHFQDFNISNESLTNMERMLSESQNAFDGIYSGGTDMGYDYISQMRGFDGVRPEQYELPVVQGKKKA